MRGRTRFIGFIAVLQSILFLTHYLLYKTWTLSLARGDSDRLRVLQIAVGLLSVSFVAASILAFRYTNAVLRAFYRAAAVWLGLLTFLVVAAAGSWIILAISRLAGLDVNFHRMGEGVFS